MEQELARGAVSKDQEFGVERLMQDFKSGELGDKHEHHVCHHVHHGIKSANVCLAMRQSQSLLELMIPLPITPLNHTAISAHTRCIGCTAFIT